MTNAYPNDAKQVSVDRIRFADPYRNHVDIHIVELFLKLRKGIQWCMKQNAV